MEITFWASVIIAITIAGGAGIASLALIVASVRTGHGPVKTLALMTGLYLGVAVLMAMLIYDAVFFT
ncbi:MAG: hypothetical protein Q8P66_00815 [Candidatus Colwellbacteria bacterium]|nr:hypothetical protein [Candidatus Colwellbacteria bacterium]